MPTSPNVTDPIDIFARSRGGTDPRTASDWTRRQVASNPRAT